MVTTTFVKKKCYVIRNKAKKKKRKLFDFNEKKKRGKNWVKCEFYV